MHLISDGLRFGQKVCMIEDQQVGTYVDLGGNKYLDE